MFADCRLAGLYVILLCVFRWTIKGRVTQKSGVRTDSNSKGEGKFFNCVFADESGEIKATAWKADCDAFFDIIELNKVKSFLNNRYYVILTKLGSGASCNVYTFEPFAPIECVAKTINGKES